MFPSEGEYDSSGERIPFWDQLKTIPDGTVVFQVFSTLFDTPIANIRTTSSMETCSFGDERLFFKHERMDLDFDLTDGLEAATINFGYD